VSAINEDKVDEVWKITQNEFENICSPMANNLSNLMFLAVKQQQAIYK
jgi:hypothetical protein